MSRMRSRLEVTALELGLVGEVTGPGDNRGPQMLAARGVELANPRQCSGLVATTWIDSVAGPITIKVQGSDNGTDWSDIPGAEKQIDSGDAGSVVQIELRSLWYQFYSVAVERSGNAGGIGPCFVEWQCVDDIPQGENAVAYRVSSSGNPA